MEGKKKKVHLLSINEEREGRCFQFDLLSPTVEKL